MRGVLGILLLTGGGYLAYAVITNKRVLGIGGTAPGSGNPNGAENVPSSVYKAFGGSTTVTGGAGGGHQTSH